MIETCHVAVQVRCDSARLGQSLACVRDCIFCMEPQGLYLLSINPENNASFILLSIGRPYILLFIETHQTIPLQVGLILANTLSTGEPVDNTTLTRMLSSGEQGSQLHLHTMNVPRQPGLHQVLSLTRWRDRPQKISIFFFLPSLRRTNEGAQIFPPRYHPIGYLGLWMELNDDCSIHLISLRHALPLAIGYPLCDARPWSQICRQGDNFGQIWGKFWGDAGIGHYTSYLSPFYPIKY